MPSAPDQTSDRSASPPPADSPPRKRRGPLRKLARLFLALVVLALVVVGGAPIWLSTKPGTDLVASVASRVSGQEIEIGDLDLGYGGGIMVAGLSIGDELEVGRADLAISLSSLAWGRPLLSGKVYGLRVLSVTRAGDSSPPRRSGGGIQFPSARVDLEIADCEVVLRDETVTPALEDRLEGLSGRVLYSSTGGFASTSAELVLAWQRIAVGGVEVEANAIDVRLEGQSLALAPVTARVSGGEVTAAMTLDLQSGQEKLVFSLTAEGVQPASDLAPTRGVALSGDLSGVAFLRAFIDRGQPLPSTETIVAGLDGQADFRVGELAYRHPTPIPLVGNLVTARNLDGKLTFSNGVARGENLAFELQDGDVAASVETAKDGEITVSLIAAPPGKRSGRLPVRNLALDCTVSRDLSRAACTATCDRLIIEEGGLKERMEVTGIDVAVTYERHGEGPQGSHAFDIAKLIGVLDGARVSVAGKAGVTGESASFAGKANVDGYELFPGKGQVKGVAIDADLAGIPTVDAGARLEQLRGTLAARFAELPTDFGKLTSGDASCRFDGGHADVERLKASMNGGQIDALARFYLGKRPADVRFEVRADGVSLDGAEGPMKKVELRGEFSSFALLDGLAQPGLSGSLTGAFDALPLPAVTLGKGTLAGTAKNGRIDLPTMTFDAAPGEVKGTAWIDLAQTPPAWELDVDNDEVTIRKGFGDVLGYVVPVLSAPSGNMGGKLTSDLHLVGRGFGKEELRGSLLGQGNLSLAEGQVSGSPVLRALVPVVGALDLVGIEKVACRFDIGQGKVRSDDLDMNLFYRDKPIFLGFKGWCDFDSNIDYGIKLRAITGFLPEQARAIAETLGSDVTFPLHLMGKLDSPRVGVPPIEEVIKEVGAGLKGSGALDAIKKDPGKLLDMFGGGRREPAAGEEEQPKQEEETPPK